MERLQVQPVNITTDGSGDVLWGLVRVQRHVRLHHADFRIDPEDFDEDTRFYGEVASESDHRSKSAFIPATAPLANDDPDATPTGRRPAWHRHVLTFTILGPVEAKTYRVPHRSDDDYLVRRVAAAAGKTGAGGATKFDVKVNGATFVFDSDTDKRSDGGQARSGPWSPWSPADSSVGGPERPCRQPHRPALPHAAWRA